MPVIGEPSFAPGVDLFERDGRLITKVDLPGVTKEDVSVQVTDGQLTLSGERRQETEETKDNVAVPLPQGVRLEDVKATFAEGVLEVSMPLSSQPETKLRKVEIRESAKAKTGRSRS